MLFSTYMEFLEGTDREEEFFASLAELKDGFAEASAHVDLTTLPFVGRMFAGLLSLAEAESIAAFKQTSHYEYFKDWNVKVNGGAGVVGMPGFTMWPSDETMRYFTKIVMTVMGIIAALLVIRMIRKWCKG
ncbi:MAG: hypothetical protein FWC16_12315 [Defluviitaleaceae bacterium]|nr:hypothetical protein [Defluviitaleaceae bacterium]MCL2275704.1 hypothetical protein [Defluviitaleaceae bacterium]